MVAASTHQHTAEKWMVTYRYYHSRYSYTTELTWDCFSVYFNVGYMMQYCMLLYKIKEGLGHVPLPNAQYIRD